MKSVELVDTMCRRLSKALDGSDYYVDDAMWSETQIEFQVTVFKWLGGCNAKTVAVYYFKQEWESEEDMMKRFNREVSKLVRNWKKWKED